MKIEEIEMVAKICHEANRAYCESMGDTSQVPWDDADGSQYMSVTNGVRNIIDNPDCTPEESHANWMELKLKEGWTYAERKCVIKMLHPCLVPYEDLPETQKIKDKIFTSIVKAFL